MNITNDRTVVKNSSRMSHIFVSYSKKNRDYAHQLADYLIEMGFDVWIDDEIQPSEDWWRNIRQAIKRCAAFVLVMTPEAEESHWVGLELLHALEYNKPLFPVLRAGDVNLMNSDSWSRIANVQYTDVRSGKLPKERFVQTLARRGVPRKPSHGYDVTPPPPRIEPLRGESILPPPFEWCDIPVGQVLLEEGGYIEEPTVFDVPAFAISKYPVTNGQFARFVEAEGYGQKQWWTEEGWKLRQAQRWTLPEFWDNPLWNQPDSPVVGISWYEALAFCEWLSAQIAGDAAQHPYRITLPTEQQWQRAAQGDDGRVYPWGNERPDAHHLNYGQKVGFTTPVTQYPKGASPYGVMDMSGNVWEWCLTNYETGESTLNGTDARVVHGGSYNANRDFVRAAFRLDWDPFHRKDDQGFRMVSSIS